MTNTTNVFGCPYCNTILTPNFTCNTCVITFPAKGMQPDLRINKVVAVNLEYSYTPEFGYFPWDKILLQWPVINDLVSQKDWHSVEAHMLRSVPKTDSAKLALDIGCGVHRQRFKEGLQMLGYKTVGVDIEGDAPDALADALFLPFANETFDVIMSSAVFEHLKNPFVAMKELYRVAKPGARIFLSIAYNEPFHISYFHHSPLAVHELLVTQKLTPEHFVLSKDWNAFSANFFMGFAGYYMPAFLQKMLSKSIMAYALFPARLKSWFSGDRTKIKAAEQAFTRSHSGIVGVIAYK